jgi:alginate O-acetyltransferase complex protein AlgI
LLQIVLYCVLFVVCAGVFAEVRSRAVRQGVLLVASYVLYLTWEPWFAAVLVASTVMNFLLGKWLRKTTSAGVLWVGILLNLALLSTFKYIPAVAVRFDVSSLHNFAHLALPLGISFWTFQAMSYLFDIYRGDELDPTLFEFAMYLVFFPVTISGPICRMPDMLPQFRSETLTAWNDLVQGVRRILMGVFMMQVATILGRGILGSEGVNSGFDVLKHWSGTDVWCLAVGCGLQLFLDFAGYSHVAIGVALAMGFTIPENFARPFTSANPSIFWTRWHMSLSFWIRDYVFLPLAMVRRETWWRNLALVIAMFLFGLWHQATLLFILWGVYNGVVLVLHRQAQQLKRVFNFDPPESVWVPVSWIATMAFMNLGWIFFRSTSLTQAGEMLRAVFSPASYFTHFVGGGMYLLVAGLAVGYAITLLVIDWLNRSAEAEAASTTGPRAGLGAMMARGRWYWISPVFLLALAVLVLITSTMGASTTQFMYRVF